MKKYNRLVKVAAKHLRNMGVSESGPRISRKLKSLGNPVFSSLSYIFSLFCLYLLYETYHHCIYTYCMKRIIIVDYDSSSYSYYHSYYYYCFQFFSV